MITASSFRQNFHLVYPLPNRSQRRHQKKARSVLEAAVTQQKSKVSAFLVIDPVEEPVSCVRPQSAEGLMRNSPPGGGRAVDVYIDSPPARASKRAARNGFLDGNGYVAECDIRRKKFEIDWSSSGAVLHTVPGLYYQQGWHNISTKLLGKKPHVRKMLRQYLVISGRPVHRSLKIFLGVGLDDLSDDDELRTCLYWRAGIVAARDRG
ncbi:hypothetical protein ARMGADRAFT_1123622 [Armillaria gallica]|uniref:Uncharacterized protein n=1 Tax=Armillaria gallica TaxID=47427 RepID=A0A2H3CVI0_ARMGA|nr:hypothetical protein ARMGADRAFT_1123622 [Armillaria gallica]